MLALALQRVLANTSSTTTSSDITEKLGLHPRGGHDCRKECFGGDTGQEVSVLTSWERGKRSIPKLVCPGLGVVLESWRKPDGVGLLEDVEDDDGRGEDDEWGVW